MHGENTSIILLVVLILQPNRSNLYQFKQLDRFRGCEVCSTDIIALLYTDISSASANQLVLDGILANLTTVQIFWCVQVFGALLAIIQV